jgi:hypothetical protein
MAAISKAWVTIADAAVDPDSPVDATLMTALRDIGIHLREWLGASFFAGAVQDHNHDGANSALVPVGPNLLRNGSFEDGESGWTFTDFSGGSHAISTSNHRNGAKSATITSTVLANGGGDAISSEFIAISEAVPVEVQAWIWASVANVSSLLELVWYDNSKALVSASTLQSYTNTPTAQTHHSVTGVPPTNARWLKTRITGGVPAVGSATGTITFDGIRVSDWAGGIRTIRSGSLSGTSVSITDIPQTFSKLALFVSGAACDTNSRIIEAQVSYDNGSTWDTTATDYFGLAMPIAGGVANQALASLCEPTAIATAGNPITGLITVSPYQAGPHKEYYSMFSQSGSIREATHGIQIGNAAAGINALRLLWNGSGSFNAGTYALYGIR